MQFKRKILVAASLCFLLAQGSAGAVGSESKQAVFQAKWVDGELYVKADAVAKAMDGTGSYDGNTQTYNVTVKNQIAEVVKSASPSIVAIIGKPKSESVSSAAIDDRYRLAHGTGIIISKDGWIVTNAHVVKDMTKLVVVTSDGKQYDATNPYLDEESDLALVKVKADKLSAATLAAKSDVEVGETVIAIGTPISFALRNSVTVGVVSGIDRSIHSTYRLLQTDAAINPGNSGGPLMNVKGEVIGINSLKFAAVGVENLGFAIPIDTVHYVVDQFYKYGKVKRPTLGFDVEESWAAVVGLPTTEPLTVKRVDAGSAAAKLGIKQGDVVYSVNKHNFTTLVDLNEYLKAYLPGDKVDVTMQSGGDLVVRTITLEEAK